MPFQLFVPTSLLHSVTPLQQGNLLKFVLSSWNGTRNVKKWASLDLTPVLSTGRFTSGRSHRPFDNDGPAS